MLLYSDWCTIMANGLGAEHTLATLRKAPLFQGLSEVELSEIACRIQVHNLLRGEILIRQGTESKTLYVVMSGRFEVLVDGQKNAINEIGIGEPIGEIAFFAGIARTATII